MDISKELEKIRLRRRDEVHTQDADRKDAEWREDEERRVAAAEAADIEADLQKEQDEARMRDVDLEDERGFDEQERRLPDLAQPSTMIRDVEMDPDWLHRWEDEGTMTPLTDEERAKLEAIDREDPVGRGMREQFLPREVLAIRANSDRWVAEQREQASEQEREPEPASAPEQDLDDDMEMDL